MKMINFAGSIKGKPHHPYIYAIVKCYCLYIGETQQHPVSRWGQHMSPVGSFLKKLKENDKEIWERDEPIFFMGIDCEKISLLSSEEHKIVTQYVEHKVHELCILNLPDLSPIEKIISDTSRTAPSKCKYSWTNDLASQAYKEIIDKLKQFGYSQVKKEFP